MFYFREYFRRFSRPDWELSPAASTFLDLIRIVSAVLVVMEHLASRLLVGYGDLDAPGLWVKFLYLLNLLGGPAVVVFFVLSGYFISGSIYRAWAAGGWSWRDYAGARLSRLYVVLLPALVLTWILDLGAEANGYFNDSGGLPAFFGNLIFLQTIIVPQFGSNGPLWSLANEFWYYAAFPFFVAAVLGRGLLGRIFSALAFAGILLFIGRQKSLYFILWCAGALIYFIPGVRGRGLAVLGCFSFFLFFSAMLVRPLVDRKRLVFEGIDFPLFAVDAIVAVGAALVIYWAVNFFRGRKVLFGAGVDRACGLGASFSFSLYLIHYPIVNFSYYAAKGAGFTEMYPSLSAVSLEVALVAVICLFAWGFSRFTEAKTWRVRKFISDAIGPHRAEVVPR